MKNIKVKKSSDKTILRNSKTYHSEIILLEIGVSRVKINFPLRISPLPG